MVWAVGAFFFSLIAACLGIAVLAAPLDEDADGDPRTKWTFLVFTVIATICWIKVLL